MKKYFAMACAGALLISVCLIAASRQPAVIEIITPPPDGPIAQETTTLAEASAFVTEIMRMAAPLDLNLASAQELALLPGIGETLAERILGYRMENGGFSSVDELLEVDGIGEKKLAAIRELIYVTPAEVSAAVTEKTPLQRVELNSATLEELCTLPNVDAQLAKSILELRDRIHYFSDIHELLYAEGVTDSVYVSLCDYVYVEKGDYAQSAP